MYDQVKDHILSLSDSDLVEYVVTGPRMYEPDAVAFARGELIRRNLTPEQTAALRGPIVAKVLQDDAQAPSPLLISKEPAVVCEGCGFEVPNSYAEYRQQIGLLLVRYSRNYKGRFCRTCNRGLFWRTTLITFFFGWWGVITFFVTIVALIENLITFLRTLSIPPVPSGRGPPKYDESVIAKIAPYGLLITDRLVEQADVDQIAREVASKAGVTPGQVWCYIQQLRRAKNEPPQTAWGFPVIMSPSTPPPMA